MCGFVTLWRLGDERLAADMIGRISHRARDAIQVARLPGAPVVMAHARLAIIGTENGAQPIHHGESLLVVNGEISNHAELRAALGARAFQTASDSETILHLSRTGRSRWITELNGMFAFVLATPDRIIAGRDHLGIKPLYVTTIVSQPRTLPGAWPMSSATRADVRPTLSRLWRMRTPRSRSDTTQRFHRVRPCTR